MKRILGIDLGDVRTGLAVSDPTGMLAGGIGTFTTKNEEELISLLSNTVNQYQVEKIVIGNPINMNGTIGERSQKVQEFVKKLSEEVKIPVILFDERMTTMAAHRIMNETNTRGKKRKAAVDTLSAQIILQNYLDSHPQKV
jgi:putative Holliday junction resolvase